MTACRFGHSNIRKQSHACTTNLPQVRWLIPSHWVSVLEEAQPVEDVCSIPYSREYDMNGSTSFLSYVVDEGQVDIGLNLNLHEVVCMGVNNYYAVIATTYHSMETSMPLRLKYMQQLILWLSMGHGHNEYKHLHVGGSIGHLSINGEGLRLKEYKHMWVTL